MYKYITLAFCLFFSFNSHAIEKSYQSLWNGWKSDLSKIWASDKYNAIIPINTYHSRRNYDKEKIDDFNEMPWGAGIERFYIDEKGNQHSLYALIFSDSYSKPEPMVGYIWQKNWYANCNRDMVFGLGYSVLLTGRSKGNYIPYPGLIPLASLQYKSMALQAAYVPPMGHNDGDVLFTMIKWKI